MESSHSFQFSGNKRIELPRTLPDVTNSFTYELFVKPEAAHDIDIEARVGTSGIAGQRYVISPEHGGSAHQAGAGISVGTNGVSVYEHTKQYLPALLVHEMELSDWTHIAVVYNNRTPSLYVNGILVKTGLQSKMTTVVASSVLGGLPPYGCFVGKLQYVRLWREARTAEQLQRTMHNKLQHDKQGLVYEQYFPSTMQSHLRKKGVLFILNTDGGTRHYQNLCIDEMKHTCNIYTFKPLNRTIYIHSLQGNDFCSLSIPLQAWNAKVFSQMLSDLNIELIYINHLIHLPAFQLMDFIQSSGVPYLFFVPDFFSVCPSLNLLNNNGSYCHNETDTATCQSCLNAVSRTHPLFSVIHNSRLYCSDAKAATISIEVWRKRFSAFLQGAQEVITLSSSTKDIIQLYYPNISISVRKHPITTSLQPTFNPQFAAEATLTVAFIGHIQYHKGCHILYELKARIEQEALPIRIIVIGSTSIHRKPFEQPHFIVTGAYNNEQLPRLLATYHASLVITSSICPETFSYTTHEALTAGYPVMTFDLGAPAQHLHAYGGGWIVKEISSNGLLCQLKQLLSNRSEIVTKAQELKT